MQRRVLPAASVLRPAEPKALTVPAALEEVTSLLRLSPQRSQNEHSEGNDQPRDGSGPISDSGVARAGHIQFSPWTAGESLLSSC